MIDLINKVYGNLQRLEIQPTKNNVALIHESLGCLEELYARVREIGSGTAQEHPDAPGSAQDEKARPEDPMKE